MAVGAARGNSKYCETVRFDAAERYEDMYADGFIVPSLIYVKGPRYVPRGVRQTCHGLQSLGAMLWTPLERKNQPKPWDYGRKHGY